jgi:hypothetical protein
MEQSTIIILTIVLIAIVIAMQPAVCDCTSEGAASAPVMRAYLKAGARKQNRKKLSA